jgi:hypothetical protein
MENQIDLCSSVSPTKSGMTTIMLPYVPVKIQGRGYIGRNIWQRDPAEADAKTGWQIGYTIGQLRF